jgi:Transaldolase/Fructose-6-phosphate aldolase
MKATQKLHEMGQSLWLDNMTRGLLTTGTLGRYIQDFSITGLTSNPTIFDHAIKNSHDYDDSIGQKLKQAKSREVIFFELAIADLQNAADLFRRIHDQTNGVDGWVSLEVSPLLAHDTDGTLAAAKELHARAGRPNLFIKIPGTKEGVLAIEEAIFRGPADQRHLALLAGTVCRCRRIVLARHRAADRRRAESERRFRGFTVCQPLGCRGEGQNTGGTSRSTGHRRRQPDLRDVQVLARFAALAAYLVILQPSELVLRDSCWSW